MRNDDVTRAGRVSECNEKRLSLHLCVRDCHLLVTLLATLARTAWFECMNGYLIDLIFMFCMHTCNASKGTRGWQVIESFMLLFLMSLVGPLGA